MYFVNCKFKKAARGVLTDLVVRVNIRCPVSSCNLILEKSHSQEYKYENNSYFDDAISRVKVWFQTLRFRCPGCEVESGVPKKDFEIFSKQIDNLNPDELVDLSVCLDILERGLRT